MYQKRDRKEYIDFTLAMMAQGVIPRMLYKHMPISTNLINMLNTNELYFSSPQSFNDPFDCQVEDETTWDEQIVKEYYESAKENTGVDFDIDEAMALYRRNPTGFPKYFTQVLVHVINQGGIACFVKQPDNLLLWSHYSMQHSGVCLKFDIMEDLELFAMTFNVIYSSVYPKFDFMKERNNKLPQKVLLTKSEIWKYEGEIRSIQSGFGSYPFNKKCLKEIIFGCRADNKKKEEVISIVKNREYPDVSFKQVKLLPKSFGIEIINL